MMKYKINCFHVTEIHSFISTTGRGRSKRSSTGEYRHASQDGEFVTSLLVTSDDKEVFMKEVDIGINPSMIKRFF